MPFARMFQVLVLTLVVSSCASPNSSNFGMGGVDSKMIGPAEAVVAVNGNALTSRQRVNNLLLARAAKLTVAAGRKSFSLLTIEDAGALKAIKKKTIVAYLRKKAAVSNGRAKLTTQRARLLVNGISGGVHTRHGGGFFVVMYNGGNGAYDAVSLNKSLAGKL